MTFRLGSYTRYILLRDLVEQLAGAEILDVGCNYGELLQRLNVKNQSVGIEGDPRAIQNALVRDPSLNIVHGNATQLPFVDNRFNVVFCLCVLEHIRDDQKAVAEIARVLEPKGQFIFTVPTCSYQLITPFFGRMLRFINQLMHTQYPTSDKEYVKFGIEGIGHVRWGYSIDDLNNMLKDEHLVATSLQTCWHFPSRLAYMMLSPLLEAKLIPLALAKAIYRLAMSLDRYFPDDRGDYLVIATKSV